VNTNTPNVDYFYNIISTIIFLQHNSLPEETKVETCTHSKIRELAKVCWDDSGFESLWRACQHVTYEFTCL